MYARSVLCTSNVVNPHKFYEMLSLSPIHQEGEVICQAFTGNNNKAGILTQSKLESDASPSCRDVL